MPQHPLPVDLLARATGPKRVRVGLDLDKTLVQPEEAFVAAMVIELSDHVPIEPIAPWYELMARDWLRRYDEEWKSDGPTAVLGHGWGFSAHEGLLGPMTLDGNALIAPGRRDARRAVIDRVRPMAVETLRSTAEMMRAAVRPSSASSHAKQVAADWVIKHAESVVEGVRRRRLDPATELPVLVPGAKGFLEWVKARSELEPWIGTNGDPQVQVEGKIADANRRYPELFTGIPVVVSGEERVDAAKPAEPIFDAAEAVGPGTDVAMFVDDRHDTGVLGAERRRAAGHKILPVLLDLSGQRLASRQNDLRRQVSGREIAIATSHADTAAIAEALSMGADPSDVASHFSVPRAMDLAGVGEMVGLGRESLSW